MKVFITGANGFVGQTLTDRLLRSGHEVTWLVRSQKSSEKAPKGVSLVVGDPTVEGRWQESVSDHTVLVNLAGATIFKRWTQDYKRLIYDSRILTTRNLVQAAASGSRLLSTSAVGYYGFTGDEQLDESAPVGSGFLAELAADWENEALEGSKKGLSVAITRFGVVLGRDGGALAQMVLPFRFFAGGPLGSGKQWMSWIHIEDLCKAAMFLMDNTKIEGPVNFCSPEPVQNKSLAKVIGAILKRPSFMPAPGFAINLILGEFGSVILKGQRVIPLKLMQNGFTFKYPDVQSALSDLLQ